MHKQTNKQTNKPEKVSLVRSVTDVAQFFVRWFVHIKNKQINRYII